MTPESGGHDIVVAGEEVVVLVVAAVDPIEPEVCLVPAEAGLRIVADTRAEAELAAELPELLVAVVRVGAGLPTEVTGLALGSEAQDAVHAHLIEDLRAVEGLLHVARLQPVEVADQRLDVAGGEREILVGLPLDVGVLESVVEGVEIVGALERGAEFERLLEHLRIEAEAETPVFPSIRVALIGIHPVVLPLVLADQLELLQQRVRVVLIKDEAAPQLVEHRRFLRGGRAERLESHGGSGKRGHGHDRGQQQGGRPTEDCPDGSDACRTHSRGPGGVGVFHVGVFLRR